MNQLIRTNDIYTVVDAINDSEFDGPRLLSIWGASGSGKTYLAEHASNLLPGSRVINVDNYLSEETIAGPRFPVDMFVDCIEGINPAIWDQERLNKDLIVALAGRALNMPQFDSKNRVRRVEERMIEPSNLTIVEGAYSYENAVQEHIDMLIVVESSLHSRFVRKIARTVNGTGRTDIDESVHRYLNQTQASLDYTWNRHVSNADVIYENNPVVSSTQGNDDARIGENTGCLSPMDGYGQLQDGELLVIDSNKQGGFTLRHIIGDTAILRCMISKDSLNLIRNYYVEK